MKKLLIAGVIMSATATSAQADILAAGSIYGGPQQTAAVCYIYNAGSGPVTILSRTIFREPNTGLATAFNSCPGALAAGSSCGFSANIAAGAAHNCRFVVTSSGGDVRGSFEIRNANGFVLVQTNLR